MTPFPLSLSALTSYLECLVGWLSNFADGQEQINQLDETFKEFPIWEHMMVSLLMAIPPHSGTDFFLSLLQHFRKGVSNLSYVTADSMKSVLFQLHHAVYGLNLENDAFHELPRELLEWYLDLTTQELTVKGVSHRHTCSSGF